MVYNPITMSGKEMVKAIKRGADPEDLPAFQIELTRRSVENQVKMHLETAKLTKWLIVISALVGFSATIPILEKLSDTPVILIAISKGILIVLTIIIILKVILLLFKDLLY